MEKPEEMIVISDPGMVGRAEHNTGDRAVVVVANLFAWIFPALIIAIVAQVVLRQSGMNQAWLDDLQWWLYGASMMIGIGYAVTTNSHVRVDIFFANFSRKRQTRVEIFGLVWLFLPFVILSWDLTLHYAIASIQAREGSDSPNGLHMLYLLKTFANLSFVFIGIAVWAAYVRFLGKLTHPALWKQLLFAFPSTMFLTNLAVYYALYWWVFLTGPEDLNPRQIPNEPVFAYTVTAAAVATVLLIALAWLLRRKTLKDA
ncbi:TRAP transporter small permease subunit [Rhodobacteraceae bacterium 2CG4]|uniref:TRAP transporter small permease protein n=1 Tax=Halovulum marinum TaxID=2662447 RepID=A0A6L5YXU3_9RHOB|nr:TRAP transporter small permease subunit [Halovulum marinum]MSU89156.1 TRAP transporter small permease subunit [Halovulum marinum]